VTENELEYQISSVFESPDPLNVAPIVNDSRVVNPKLKQEKASSTVQQVKMSL
jgi:S-adenosylmethionine:tRNA-ribosyltransferase-isomerase (queuine synthetase)